MIAFSGGMATGPYDTGTATTSSSLWTEDTLWCTPYYHKPRPREWPKCRKPVIAEDAQSPVYKLEYRPMQHMIPFLTYKMMFDNSGYLPKRIRRIRKNGR